MSGVDPIDQFKEQLEKDIDPLFPVSFEEAQQFGREPEIGHLATELATRYWMYSAAFLTSLQHGGKAAELMGAEDINPYLTNQYSEIKHHVGEGIISREPFYIATLGLLEVARMRKAYSKTEEFNPFVLQRRYAHLVLANAFDEAVEAPESQGPPEGEEPHDMRHRVIDFNYHGEEAEFDITRTESEFVTDYVALYTPLVHPTTHPMQAYTLYIADVSNQIVATFLRPNEEEEVVDAGMALDIAGSLGLDYRSVFERVAFSLPHLTD